MVDGVVPTVQLGAVEAVVPAEPAVPGMPFAEQRALVARASQRLREGELPVGQILEVADVPLVVGEQPVAERGIPGEHARAGRGADGRGRVPAVEAGARGGERVEVRGAHRGVPVAAQGVAG